MTRRYAELEEAIPTDSPEYKRADTAARERQRIDAIEETQKMQRKKALAAMALG